jgi:SAM-dependent methyltransferase
MYIHTEDVHNTRAASHVVPFLYKTFRPASVLDIGCGTGTWLKVFSQNDSIHTLQGVDGDYIDMGKLVIPAEWLLKHDLTTPLDLHKRFDLVMSFEVAEHLPGQHAGTFVETLVRHGDVIVFSAAVPGQVGQNHVNEQWQSYWADLFAQHGYRAYDLLRPMFWHNDDVDVWYRQNILVYSKKELPAPEAALFDVIHPELWKERNRKIASYEAQLQRIRDGKAGLFFPLKSLLKSLSRFGARAR